MCLTTLPFEEGRPQKTFATLFVCSLFPLAYAFVSSQNLGHALTQNYDSSNNKKTYIVMTVLAYNMI